MVEIRGLDLVDLVSRKVGIWERMGLVIIYLHCANDSCFLLELQQKLNFLTIRFITIAVLLSDLFLYGCGSGDNGTDNTYTSMGNIHTPVEIKLIHGTVPVVRVVLNGSMNLNMLVDTGSSMTYVPDGIFINPDRQVYISSLCFENNLCFNNFMALSSDSAFTQSKDGYYNGIIGIDLLKNFDLTFDYKNELIYFYDTLENGSSGFVAFPIHYESGRPFTNVSIEGMEQGATLLDTGAAYTRITSLILDSLIQVPEVLFKSVTYNFDVSEVVDYIVLNDYCAGMACPEEVIVQIGSWPSVGGTFFREYLTIFKFSENVVKLSRYYDNDYIKESGIQRTGLQINIFDASEIIYVNEGSSAWEGGLREGFEIISVNEIPIDSLGYFGVYDFLSDTSIEEYQFLVVTKAGDMENVILSIE